MPSPVGAFAYWTAFPCLTPPVWIFASRPLSPVLWIQTPLTAATGPVFSQSSCSAGPVAEGAEAVCSAAPCSSQLLSWDGGLEYSGFSSSTLCGGFLFLTNWGRCGGDITASRHQPYCREVRMQTTVKPLCHPQSVTQNVPVCSADDRRTLQ